MDHAVKKKFLVNLIKELEVKTVYNLNVKSVIVLKLSIIVN